MPLLFQKNKVLFIIICLVLVSLSTYVFSLGTSQFSFNSNDLKAYTLQEDEIETVQREDFYRNITHNQDDDFFVLKTDTLILFSSQAWREKFGYEENEVNKHNFFSFVHAKDLPFFTNSMIKVIDNGEIKDNIGPFRLKSKSGEESLYMASAVPLFNKQGEIVSIILMLRDVSVPVGQNDDVEVVYFNLEEELISMM